MSWLSKIIQAQLEREWWRNAQDHMVQVVETQLMPIPRKNPWPYDSDEIVYLPRSGQPIVYAGFSQSNLHLVLDLFRKSKIYKGYADLQFDQPMNNFLTYDEKFKYKYRTDRVQGFKNINANLLGITCWVRRIKANSGVGWESAKNIGSIELLDQELAPYYILDAIQTLIMSDTDDNEGEEETNPIPQDDSFAPVGSPNTPELVGI